MGNKEIVVKMYEDFAKGDLPAVLAVFDPQIEWNEAAGFPSVGGRHIGPDAVASTLGRVMSEWDAFSVSPETFVAQGDIVVVLGETRGTHRSTLRPFVSSFAHVWRLRDGKIVFWRAHIDTALAQQAAGPSEQRNT